MDDLTPSAPALPEEPSVVEPEPVQKGTPPKGHQVFESVKNMLETVQKVGWKDAVSSMDYASQYITTCEVAQNFVATYMQQIISILLDQDFVKLNSMAFERNCVEQSLQNAIKVVANDLKRAVGSNSTSCLLTTLGMIFNPGRLFYQKHKNSWNSSSSASNDGFRLNLISSFTSIGGMASLVSYIKARSPEELLDTSKIGLETLNYLLLGAEISLRLNYVRPSTPPPKSPYETPPPTPERTSNVAIASPPPTPVSPSTPSAAKPATDPLKANLSHIIHKLISILVTTPESELKSLTPDSISEVISTIQTLYTSLSPTPPTPTLPKGANPNNVLHTNLPPRPPNEFYSEFIFPFTLNLLKSKSLPSRLYGWEFLTNLIERAKYYRPPPTSYSVEGAGLEWMNGTFIFANETNPDGSAKYVADAPKYTMSTNGKVITLFRCQMRSNCKWWFISEADPEQPGTDKDIDYYQHKSSKFEESMPPEVGWMVSKCSDMSSREPPPYLTPIMEPNVDTLEHQIAKFIIREDLLGLIFGSHLHREVLNRSSAIVKFLATMGKSPLSAGATDLSEFSLTIKHISHIWETGKNQGVMESDEIYKLLAGTLHEMEDEQAKAMLSMIASNLKNTSNITSTSSPSPLQRVGSFCEAVAKYKPIISSAVTSTLMDLVWATLVYPTTTSNPLKPKKLIEDYFFSVMRDHTTLRETFTRRCTDSLTLNSSAAVDESLTSTTLSIFLRLLQSSPSDEVVEFVESSDSVPDLLVNETIEFLKRSNAASSKKYQAQNFSQRLTILRFVYGQSDNNTIEFRKLQQCWELTSSSLKLREEFLSFLAEASGFDYHMSMSHLDTSYGYKVGISANDYSSLKPAFPIEVCYKVFQSLICQSVAKKQDAVSVKAYKSINILIDGLNDNKSIICERDNSTEKLHKEIREILWSIALNSDSDDVVDSAGAHLLNMYSQSDSAKFVDTIFKAMDSSKSPPNAQSVNRCMKLLTAAMNSGSDSKYEKIIHRLSTMDESNCRAVISSVPHGLKSAACKKSVTIEVKWLDQNSSRPETVQKYYSLMLHPLETLASVVTKVATLTGVAFNLFKPMCATGKRSKPNISNTPIANASFDTTMSEFYVTDGTKLILMLRKQPDKSPQTLYRPPYKGGESLDVNEFFGETKQSAKYFSLMLKNLEQLGDDNGGKEAKALTWDFLRSIRTNHTVVMQVKAAAGLGFSESEDDNWASLLSPKTLHKSVYTMQVIDFLLQPSSEIGNKVLIDELTSFAVSFKKGFIATGGFSALLKFFIDDSNGGSKMGMGNAVALRVLKFCLFGGDIVENKVKNSLLKNIKDPTPLLNKLAMAALGESNENSLNISNDRVILDAVEMLRLLLLSSQNLVSTFVKLKGNLAENLVMKLLLKEGIRGSGGSKIRETMHNLIIDVEALGIVGFGWLLKCLSGLGVEDDNVDEFFSVLKRLVKGNVVPSSSGSEKVVGPSSKLLADLATRTCKKLIELGAESKSGGNPAVLNGCLSLTRRLLETKVEGGGMDCLKEGCKFIEKRRENKAFVGKLTSKLEKLTMKGGGKALVLNSLVGLIFEDFLFAIGERGMKPICTSDDSRKAAFTVLLACARADPSGSVVNVILEKIGAMVEMGEAGLRNKYGFMVSSDGKSEGMMSGLRNQGCTCYMNSLLQQLFMMKDLRDSLCDAPISKKLRGGLGIGEEGGKGLVGKRLSMFWETGGSFDCKVVHFDEKTGMHTIKYDIQKKPSLLGGGMGAYGNYHQRTPNVTTEDMIRAWNLEERVVELFLTEGRHGKETGNFQLHKGGDNGFGEGRKGQGGGEESGESGGKNEKGEGEDVEEEQDDETESERKSRRMLEELQKTFVHLSNSEKRCFDPRSLVEASDCLRLEYDVWQQNDASEYQTKLLDSLEIALKKHAPKHCNYLTEKFQMGITKQKICKACGLKTNREEVVVNLEGPVRGRSDILELIEGYCSEELMDGDNQVTCEACDKKTDTILRTCISKLPQVLTVSLKRFDLDYTTFETVKLNSRMEFGTSLNMKKYTLEGFEMMDKYKEELKQKEGDGEVDGAEDEKQLDDSGDAEVLADTSAVVDPLEGLSDAGNEYKLSGVLVHAGVAQGGHYYSFIKDRDSGMWFKFDDDDVTPFDLTNLENECFGGKMIKESKWPNGTVNNVETERYANALMLFYEKVEEDIGKGKKCADTKAEEKEEEEEKETGGGVASDAVSGKEAFESLVQKDNDTHIRYSYLFDNELSSFLRNVVVLGTQKENAWGTVVPQSAMTFFFDVFLHGTTTTKSLKMWSDILIKALSLDDEACIWLCTELAERTKKKSGNWLRSVASDCIDSGSREAGLRVIAYGMRRCIERSKTEESKLTVWTESWKKQTAGLMMGGTVSAIPSGLIGDMAQFENWKTAGSSVGAILGFINQLAEEFVMYSKDGVEFLNFVEELTKTEGMRQGLVSSHLPGRVATLLTRDSSPGVLKEAYPGCSLNGDAVELMKGGGTGGVGAHGQTIGYGAVGMTGSGVIGDDQINVALLSLFGALAKVKGIHKASIVAGGVITEKAKAAFTEMWESCRDGKVGMDLKSIENCMILCGVQINNVHAYQVTSILNKYETVPGKGGEKCLTLAGFLKYHKDTGSANEDQLRNDLNTFGFRRDLSKREEVTVKGTEGGELTLSVGVLEAAALDAGKDGGEDLGELTEIGLVEAGFWSTCFSCDEGLAASVLAACFVGKGGTSLINNVLVGLFENIGQWNFAQTAGIYGKILTVLGCITDDFQPERLSVILQSHHEIKGVAVGLIPMAREFAMNNSRYANQTVHGDGRGPAYTYIDIIKRMRESQKVKDFMNEEGRVAAWKWMEQWLTDRPVMAGGGVVSVGGNNTFDSDSDEESLGPLIVSGAGVEAVNGRYGFSGIFDKVGKWTKEGDRTGTMCLYRCKLNDNSRRWYISIVPRGRDPGTKDDKDYYQNYGTRTGYSNSAFPPQDGWVPVVKHNGMGVAPGPEVRRDFSAVADGDGLGVERGGGIGGDMDDEDDDEEDLYEDVPELSYV